MQRAYISKLMELAQKDSDVLHLVADSGTGLDELFLRNFPNQMVNFGISEEHMVAAAAGLATAGKKPFVFTAGAFLCYRALEFIRDDICFQNLNVKIIGMGSGLSWSTLGPTHHTTEDIAVLRSIPNLMILSPATPLQVEACVEEAYRHSGPVYVRIGMNHEKEFYDSSRIPVLENSLLNDVGEITVLSTGSILEEVEKAASLLAENAIDIRVVNVCSIKPFDIQGFWELCARTKLFVTVEEHNVLGGLGSIVSELLTSRGLPIRVLRVGLEDQFAVGYGTHEQVRCQNSLDAESICKKLLGVIHE